LAAPGQLMRRRWAPCFASEVSRDRPPGASPGPRRGSGARQGTHSHVGPDALDRLTPGVDGWHDEQSVLGSLRRAREAADQRNRHVKPVGPWGDRDAVAWAISTGRITASAGPTYAARMAQDPVGTAAELERYAPSLLLEANVVPTTARRSGFRNAVEEYRATSARRGGCSSGGKWPARSADVCRLGRLSNRDRVRNPS
jgi:hypothetical protein